MASSRFDGLEAAADVLLTQELVNTKRPGEFPVDDLLGEVDLAQSWLDEVASRADRPGPAPRLTEDDLPELRELREVLDAELGGSPRRALRGVVQLTARDGSGAVATAPIGGSAAAWLEASVLTERLRAEITGTWSRLKLCANPDCRIAFTDRSRNRSAVWHSVERCGNKINLRNHRARRAAGASEAE